MGDGDDGWKMRVEKGDMAADRREPGRGKRQTTVTVERREKRCRRRATIDSRRETRHQRREVKGERPWGRGWETRQEVR